MLYVTSILLNLQQLKIVLTLDEEDIDGSITDHELNRRSVSERDFNEICKYSNYIYIILEGELVVALLYFIF